MRENKLNDLDAKEWMKFTKTWFVHNPGPRSKSEKLHPAKYPESMIEGFIRFFTKEGATVLDPFLGTGSTLVACSNSGRRGIGIELQEKYGQIAQERVKEDEKQKVIVGDSFDVKNLVSAKIDMVITSPPYGPMLNKKGLVTAKREKEGLDLKYSEDLKDLGNEKDYSKFVARLVDLFASMKDLLNEGAYLVVVLQNYREGPTFKTLAWDFAQEMEDFYTLVGCKIWCQDNKTLYPYGYRYSFVPNVHHHECLIFRKEKESSDLTVKISQRDIGFFRRKAINKINYEGWGGRKKIKIDNFTNCWVTEEAFHKLLGERGKWHRNRGLYIGDAEGAGVDFVVKIDGEEKTVGIRSINKDSAEKWKTVAYPNDRFEGEKGKIGDFIVVCYNCNGSVMFLGLIDRSEFLLELGNSEVILSKKNKEKFRVVDLEKFSVIKLKEWLEKLD